jgi:hypothetical protein
MTEQLYKVKPLVWVEDADGLWLAKAAGTTYSVWTICGRTSWDWTESAVQRCDSVEDGKAKAEQHHRERIAAALEPMETREGELREMLAEVGPASNEAAELRERLRLAEEEADAARVWFEADPFECTLEQNRARQAAWITARSARDAFTAGATKEKEQ